MSTIAFDGITLAADRAAWSGGCKYRVRKVFNVTATTGKRYLVAFCGDGHFAQAVLSWMRGGQHPGAYPTTDNVVIAVVIDEQRRIWRLESTALRYGRVLERLHACGGGQDFAIGALEGGATAVQAVRIAIKRSEMAGLGVDSVRFL